MDKREDKIKGILKSAAIEHNKRNKNLKRQEIVISGDNNIAGESITVIKTEEIKIKPRVKVVPGQGVIDDKQAATIKRLVSEIVTLETKLKRNPKHYSKIYNSLFKHLSKNKRHPEITMYRLIPLEQFEKAEKYLRTWIGRLTSLKSAPKKDPSWRKRKYAFIHTNIKKYNLKDRLALYLIEKFNTASLSELADNDLQKVYRAVYEWKRAME